METYCGSWWKQMEVVKRHKAAAETRAPRLLCDEAGLKAFATRNLFQATITWNWYGEGF